MEDIMMILVVVPFFIFGYYVMKRVDIFRQDNRK